MEDWKKELIVKATQHVKDILVHNLKVNIEEFTGQKFLIIHDSGSDLAEILTEAYSANLPNAQMISFYEKAPEEVIMEVDKRAKGDLVILIESTSFRMSNFRWRLELFHRGLDVIEHAHMDSNNTEELISNYIDTLAYDGERYARLSEELKARLDRAQKVELVGMDGVSLIYAGGMEDSKKNIGDYTGMNHRGSGFPIGEVFSEALDLKMVNGEATIGAFADINHEVAFCQVPIKVIVNNGCLQLSEQQIEGVDQEDIRKFIEMLDLVKTENPDQLIWIRELGLGLNKAISKNKRLADVTAYERVAGPHISMGLKHDVYRKKVTDRLNRFHIDIFPDVERIEIDGEVVFKSGEYVI